MIYIKKKSLIKRIKNKIINASYGAGCINFGFFVSFIKIFVLLIIFLFLALYVLYLFFMPKFINEANLEKAVNNYLLKNTKLILDIDNIKIKPDYKFDVCIYADKINLKYNTKNNFITINNIKTDVNFITLFFGYIDFDNIKIKDITINSNFTKNKRYNSIDYIPFEMLDSNKNSKFKIRNLKASSDNFVLNLYDENIKKQFKITAKNIKFEKKYNFLNNASPFSISAKGSIYAQNKKLNDFSFDLFYKSKKGHLKKIKSILEKINYNPFVYADEYNFYSNSIVDLKIDRTAKKNNIQGQIKLNNLTFSTKGVQIPENNLLINFKNDKIYSDFNFYFIKNQFIKVKSTVNVSKNKFIELNLNSNEINLADLHEIISAFSKILNIKFNFDDLELKGLLDVNLYIKSDFKKINSKGNLKIENASLKHKKLNLSLDSIISNVNFKDNKINIINSSAYFDKSKFNISGQIDENANLNIQINSDVINCAQFYKFISSLPLISKMGLNLNDYIVKSGFLKIDSKIKGKLNNPVIESHSSLKNLSLFIKSLKSNVLIDEIKIIPDISNNKFNKASIEAKNIKIKYQNYNLLLSQLKLLIYEKEIIISKSKLLINNLQAGFEGAIKNYASKNPEINLKLNSYLNIKNNLITVKNIKNPNALLDITIKNNNIYINDFSILSENRKSVSITGSINNFLNKNIYLDKIKIVLNEKIQVLLKDEILFGAIGNLELNGELKTPEINGVLNIYSLIYKKAGLYIQDALLNIKNSNCYINIANGKIFDSYFDLTTQMQYKNDKIIADYLNINSQYIDFSKFGDLLSTNSNTQTEIEISNLKGNIAVLKMPDFDLNKLSFEGELKNGVLNLNKLSAEVFEGKIEGKISTNIKNQNTNANLILKVLNVRLIQGLLKEFQIAASGRLSSLIDVKFSGYDIDSILKTLDGYVKFNINDGELAQFAKLERFLQAGNILSQSILKLTLNSTLSTISKQNTGYFKTIEGTIKVKDCWANIQYLKSQGINMSLYMEGRFNLLTMYTRLTILGRIPSSIVSVWGDIGNFSTEKLVNKMSDDTKELVKSITVSPLEKMLTMKVLKSDIAKIPPLVYKSENTTTREFLVKINGNAASTSSIQMFKWVIEE